MYSNSLVLNILKYIDNNIGSKISIADLEKQFHYNRFYIMKLFKKELNITIVDYINSMRIYNSIIQIKNSNKNLLSIAYQSGFFSLEYFSEIFKNIVGVNPQLAKDYFRRKKKINIGKINLINNSFFKLYSLKSKKDKYLVNIKPNIYPVKKLSIFKTK